MRFDGGEWSCKLVLTAITLWGLTNAGRCFGAADAICAPGPPVFSLETATKITALLNWAINFSS